MKLLPRYTQTSKKKMSDIIIDLYQRMTEENPLKITIYVHSVEAMKQFDDALKASLKSYKIVDSEFIKDGQDTTD